jgi:hypothetical protein
MPSDEPHQTGIHLNDQRRRVRSHERVRRNNNNDNDNNSARNPPLVQSSSTRLPDRERPARPGLSIPNADTKFFGSASAASNLPPIGRAPQQAKPHEKPTKASSNQTTAELSADPDTPRHGRPHSLERSQTSASDTPLGRTSQARAKQHSESHSQHAATPRYEAAHAPSYSASSPLYQTGLRLNDQSADQPSRILSGNDHKNPPDDRAGRPHQSRRDDPSAPSAPHAGHVPGSSTVIHNTTTPTAGSSSHPEIHVSSPGGRTQVSRKESHQDSRSGGHPLRSMETVSENPQPQRRRRRRRRRSRVQHPTDEPQDGPQSSASHESLHPASRSRRHVEGSWDVPLNSENARKPLYKKEYPAVKLISPGEIWSQVTDFVKEYVSLDTFNCVCARYFVRSASCDHSYAVYELHCGKTVAYNGVSISCDQFKRPWYILDCLRVNVWCNYCQATEAQSMRERVLSPMNPRHRRMIEE